MAIQSTPYVETALSHSSELFRRELQSGLPIGSAGGVVPATPVASASFTAGVAACSDLQVTAPASGMSVNVSAGQVIVPGSLGSGSTYGIGTGYGYPQITLNGGSAPTVASNAPATSVALTTQGAYYCYNDNSGGALNFTIGSAQSQPRIDVVVAQVEDSAYSGSNNDWKVAVIPGTASATPAIPTLPANCIPLALVWVPTGLINIASANIIDLRVAYNRNPFKAEMNRTAAYTQASAADVVFPFDTVAFDTTGACNTGTSTFTCPVGGLWLATCYLNFSPVAGDRYALSLRRNGTAFYRNPHATMPDGTSTVSVGGAVPVLCNPTDTLEWSFKSDTATNVGFIVGAGNCVANWTLMSPQ